MSTNRETLLKIASLVRPALATQDYIPALKHISFDGQMATAYNDISAISVRCDLDTKRLIPGELLIRALSSFNAESVVLQEDRDGAIVMKSGRSKVKVPTLELAKFPLELPKGKAEEIKLTESIRKGIQACLLSVGTDATKPATMGVTLDITSSGKAMLFSTDNFTISSYVTDTKINLPGDAPVILPTFFCEQVLKLAGAFPTAEAVILIYDGALVAEFGNDLALVFSKTLVDLQPLDFPKIVSRHCDVEGIKFEEIPAGFDEALDRALLVLSAEDDRATKIIPGEGTFTMQSTSQLGDADDRFTFEAADVEAFYVDPAHLSRGGKACTVMQFLPRVLVMADADQSFIHLVSHVDMSKKK